MPSKQKRRDPPGGLAAGEEEKSEIQDSRAVGGPAARSPEEIAAVMGGELPDFKDQTRSVQAPLRQNYQQQRGVSLPTGKDQARTVEAQQPEYQMVEGIPIGVEAEVPQPAASAGVAGSSAVAGPSSPPTSSSPPTDIRKHVIWAMVILCITVTVGVVVGVVVSSSNSSPSPTTPTLPTNESPTSPAVQPNTPPPQASVNPSTPNPLPPPTPIPVAAPTLPPTPTAPQVMGWFLSELGQSCNSVCASAGRSCNAAGSNRVDSTEKMLYVAETLLGLSCTSTAATGTFSPYLQISDNSCVYQCCDNHSCSASFGGYRKICCCSDNHFLECPVSAA